MPDVPYAIDEKLETALRAYLAARVAAAGPCALTGVELRVRKEITNRFFPRVIIQTLRVPSSEDVESLYLCELMVGVYTEATEPDAAARHPARVGLVAEWLADGAALLAFVNSATPPVADFHLYALHANDQQGDQTLTHWIDAFSYEAPCQLTSS